ncbi:MAG: hypothetical protein WC500_02485 [Candidatus Margulisiibacteriota bacterium]
MANNNGFIGGMRALGRAYCEYGRANLATGGLAGVRAHFPTQAEWKYLPAGLYYHFISALASQLAGVIPAEPAPLTITSVAMAKNDWQSRGLSGQASGGPVAASSYVARSITMQPVRNREASERVFSRIKTNSWVKKHEFTRAEFDQWFDLSFRQEELSRFPGKDELFKFMIGEFKIEKHPDKEELYRIVSQISVLKLTSEDLVSSLEMAETLHEIGRSAEQCLGKNWTSSSLFIADPATGLVRLAARRKGNESESHYSAWAEPAYLLAEARRRYVEEDDKAFVVNLNDDPSFVDKASRERDAQNFIGERAELLVGVLVYKSREDQQLYKNASPKEREAIRARSVYGYWHVSNRVFNDEEGQAMYEENFNIANRPPISPNTDKTDLIAKLHSLVLHPVAEKIAARKEARGGSISSIWNSEEKPEETSGEKVVRSPIPYDRRSGAEIQKVAFDPTLELSSEDKLVILEKGEIKDIQGQRVRIFEYPYPKVRDRLNGFINWMRDTVLLIYEKAKIAEGKTKEEMIASLSLEDEPMMERTVNPRYTVLIEGAPGKEEDVLGIVSFSLIEVNNGDKRVEAMKIPAAMIREEARGKKLQVAITNEIGRRLLYKYWYEHGIIKGFWLALTKGIPVYATSQSLRVIKDFARMSNFSLKRTLEGRALTDEQRLIIDQGSQNKTDENGIETGAYGGRIAIDEEEAGVKIFGKSKDAELRDLLRTKVGENGRIHMVAYYTLWVGLKTMVELAWNRFWRRMGRS